MSTSLVGSEQKPQGVGALCHLVEAATALSKLVEAPKEAKKQATAQQMPAASSIPVAAAENKSVISDDEEDVSKKNEMRCKREIFPQRLMAILNDTSLAEIVTWLPNGRSFVIVRPDVFTDTVLPKYLPPVDARGSTKYPSFTRKLNRWGFRQITRGPDTGAFHHPLFRRDEPLLCLQMVCQRSRDRRSSSKSAGGSGVAAKKRVSVGDANEVAVAPVQTAQPTRPRLSPTLVTACVSSDDGGSSSGSSVSASSAATASRGGRISLLNVALPPSTVSATKHTPPMPRPPSTGYVSKDATLIRSALRQSVENERIRTAKAMLYHSYMQALSAADSR